MPTTFASHFETKPRASGETFVTLKDDAPDWLKVAVHESHQGDLPLDWIYEECRAAVEAFDEGQLTTDEDDDDVHEYASGRVDVYTKQLYQWAADFCLSGTFADAEQEAKDMGMPEETDKRIAAIQYAVIRHIADTLKLACVKASATAESAGEST